MLTITSSEVGEIAYEQGGTAGLAVPRSFPAKAIDTFEITVIHNDVLSGRQALMYAIVETGGKQYRVENGTLVQVESLPGDVGGTVELNHVRLVHGDKGVLVGQPLVKGAKVTAEIVDQGRTRSIMVFKKQRRKNYRRTKGHRQGYTKLRITGIATA
jgi:large subunit ribosomal protein L21